MASGDSTASRMHRFDTVIMAGELPRQFTWPFHYVPHPLCRQAADQVMHYVATRGEWADELAQGKMLGVLVASDGEGNVGFLAAYSGTLAGRNDHPWFVPPVYDLLDPDGLYRRGEREITEMNRRIDQLQRDAGYANAIASREQCRQRQQQEQEAYKALMAQARARRHELRLAAPLHQEQARALILESQHQSAELKRMQRRHALEMAEHDARVAHFEQRIARFKAGRKQRSEQLQRQLFDLYVVSNARGERQSLTQVFARFALREHQPHRAVPPGGAGECCAPKLLQYAFDHHLHPLCMAEFWHGASPAGEVRHHGHFYPACRSKCYPILTFMLQGLDVEDNQLAEPSQADIVEVYDDPWLTVVNKPAGMLSEPGKLLSDSALTRFKERHPEATGPVLVHRLDQETSGLLVFAKDKATHKELQRQWAEREVVKEYVALLDGTVTADSGTISLPLRPNADDRPRQVVDFDRGKPATTRYQVLERTPQGTTRVRFTPHTGRTHQLRVHASHPLGLGCPIHGDRLYGTAAERLMLHAARITFTHPATGQTVTVRCLLDPASSKPVF